MIIFACRKYALPFGAIICLLPWIDGAFALLLGACLSLFFGNTFAGQIRKVTRIFLSLSIIGLGAGMNLVIIAQAGISGFFFTAISIALTLSAGLFIGRLIKTERETSLLLSVGTAICGGSAIAAVAPVIHAKPHSITVSLGVVFLLNALALVLFPWIGQVLDLSQLQFGLWSALAIHDTSSVVGAGMKYGPEALQIGTTVKLARALWIIPLVFLIQMMWNKNSDNQEKPKTKYPWFILGFLGMAALFTFVPALEGIGQAINILAKRMLVVTLFFIGAGITRETLREVGFKPLLQGVLLWFLVAAASLLFIQSGFVH